jgi:hypothetical protein
MRWYCCVLLLLAGCTSTWERHRSRLADDEAGGDFKRAAAEVRWQIDNAFVHGPAKENTPAAEASRYLHLSALAVKNGNTPLAIEALHEALRADPRQARAVRAQLDRLPVSAAERDRLQQEFAWNATALAPAADARVEPEETNEGTSCWSYRVRELRIRHRRIVKTPDGMQRQANYDARPWMFDATAGRWHVEGDWVADAGTETELVGGPEQPRYRAVTAADHLFYADGTIPSCHRAGWAGPYAPSGTLFVAARLPIERSAPPSDH